MGPLARGMRWCWELAAVWRIQATSKESKGYSAPGGTKTTLLDVPNFSKVALLFILCELALFF